MEILQLLESRSLDVPRKQALAGALRWGRWCWPAENAGWPFEHALRLVPGGPPPIAPGQTLLVTANEDCASLWSLLCGELTADEEMRSFGNRAESAWRNAAAALPRSLPVLWASIAEARRAPHSGRRLWSRGRLHHEAKPEAVLDGPSFGLAFVLALASRVLNAASPEDVVASACVGPDGRLTPAGDIAEKIDVVSRAAPRVRRFLIASTEEKEHERAALGAAAGTAIEIVPVSNAAAALRLVFGDDLAGLLIQAGADSVRRGELVDSLFRLALSGRDHVLDWTPVQAAAACALERWCGQLEANEQRQLGFALAVAARHENNAGVLPVPEAEWLARMPLPIRVGVLANFVQHSADTATPPAEAVEALAKAYLAPTYESFPVQLKLAGALARLYAVTGRAPAALAMQEQAAETFFAQLEYAEVSYPLTEWYRLAGVLGDAGAFDRAERLRERIDERGGLGFDGSPYVELARSRAMARLGRHVGSDPEATLRALACNERLPAHVQWSAARYYVRLLDESGREGESAGTVSEIERVAGEGTGGSASNARAFLALIHLDRALRAGNAAVARHAVERLEAEEPGIVSNLSRGVSAAEVGVTVARFYPY